MLQSVLTSPPISYSNEVSNDIIHQLVLSGFLDDNDVTNFAKGFSQREEVLSQILINDFSWEVLDAHRARVGIMELVKQTLDGYGSSQLNLPRLPEIPEEKNAVAKQFQSTTNTPKMTPTSSSIDGDKQSQSTTEPKTKLASWKSVLVNDKAKLRRTKKQQDGRVEPDNKDTYSYGLSTIDREIYQMLFDELDSFWTYMTVPQTSVHAEPPIREKTAEVYCTHARLFLGEFKLEILCLL
jgi:hypothetical protein